jgi:SAM-dependent methyltransferase
MSLGGSKMDMHKNILNSLNSGSIMYIDCDHIIRYMNAASDEMFKKSGGFDLVGKNLFDCHSKEAAHKIKEYFGKMQSGELEEVEVRKKKDMKGFMQVVKDEAGNVIGYLERHERIHETIKPQIENSYKQSAKLYDEIVAISPINEDIRFYCEVIEAGASVLEIGCGTGRVAFELAKRGNDVTGLDFSEEMLAVFHEKIVNNFESIKGKVKTVNENMLGYKLDKKFDYIIFPFRVFQMLFSPKHRKDCLANAKAHLKEGGKIIINLFDPDRNQLNHKPGETWMDVEVKSEKLGVTIKRDNRMIRHFDKQQIINFQNIYSLINEGKIIDQFVEPMRLAYLFDDQAKTIFKEANLVIEKEYGFWDYSPVESHHKRELIYILS